MTSFIKNNRLQKDENDIYTIPGKTPKKISDDQSEKYIFEVIASSHDLTSSSYQLKSKIIDVASEYHLSPKRSNLIRAFCYEKIENVLEIGCGSGSITRYLGEQGFKVDAIESNYQLAKSAEVRCRDYQKVHVAYGKPDEFHFNRDTYDLILCIGLIDDLNKLYSSRTHEESLKALLPIIRAALTPEGVALLSVQNRTGFKYIFGAHVDNSQLRYEGIHNHTGSDSDICAYSHREWEALINLAGFKYSEFIYPFPDYKLPTVLLSDNYATNDPYAYNHLESVRSRDYFSIFTAHEHENIFWESTVSNGTIGHFSNSFCILMSGQSSSLELFNPNDFAHLPAYNRNLIYTTQLEKKRGEPYIYRSRLTPATLPPFNGISHEPKAKELYHSGPLLSVEWSRSLLYSDDHFHDFESWVKAYFNFIRKREAEGKSMHIDLLPSNIIVTPEGWRLFDDEWLSVNPISIDLLIYRSVLMFVANYRPHLRNFCEKRRIYSPWDFIKWAFLLVGLPTDYQHLSMLKKQDEIFQENIADRFSPMVLETPIIDKHFADRPIISVFWKTEDQSYQMNRMCSVRANTSDDMQTVSIYLPKTVRMLGFVRIDPCGCFRKEDASFFRLASIRVFAVDSSEQAELVWSVESEPKIYKAANLVGIHYENRKFGRGFMVIDYDAWLEFFIIQFRRLKDDEKFKIELDIRYPRTPEYLLARDRHLVAAEIFKDRLKEMDTTIETLKITQTKLRAVKVEINTIKNSKIWRVAEKCRILVYHHLLPKLKQFYLPLRIFKKGNVSNDLKCAISANEPTKDLLKSNYQTWIENRPKSYWIPLEQISVRPKVSIIMSVYKTPVEIIKQAIDSVLGQTYSEWELCIADDASGNHSVVEFLKQLDDSRIKIVFRTKNGNISAASNSAAELATGDFVTFLDHDDCLHENALSELVAAAQKTGAEFIYSDEDFIHPDGHLVNPHFKPDFSADLLFSQNYITHMVLINSGLFERIGKFRLGYEGAQDYDLYLRLIEVANKIHHVPKPLYHWRMMEGSTAMQTDIKPTAHPNAKRSIVDALKRNCVNAEVLEGNLPHYFRVKRRIKGKPLVSIIIPFKDYPRLLKQAITSIIDKSSYPNFEIVGVSNDSTTVSTYNLMTEFSQKDRRIRFVQLNERFNFSRLANFGVDNAQGDHMVLFNNDVEVISPDWIESLLEHSQRREVGVVGAKLYFPNNTIQHAGIAIGLNGCAGHLHLNFPGYHEGYFNRLQIVQNISAVTGALMMVSKEIYWEIGGFDEAHFAVAFNDVDFCMKAIRKGYLNVFTPYCEGYHHESETRGYEVTQEKSQRFQKEMAHLKARYKVEIEAGDPYYNPNFHQGRDNFTFD